MTIDKKHRTSRAEKTGTSAVLKDTYIYDAIDQLTKVAYATRRTVSYAYDSVGNRTAVTDNGVTASYAVNALNQYVQAGNAAPGYDRNGNLTSMSGKSFGYDAQNRLVSASNPGVSATLTYDARNRCVSRMINGVTTYLYYDGWDLIEERNASGNVGSQYIHGVATDEMLAKIDSTTALYYHQDGLGNVVALSDAAGSTVERYTYDVFGAPTIRNAANGILTASAYGNRFLYTGREYLRELGLYDYRNRVYSADLGRFLQTDPIRFEGGDVNIYRYVGNSPIHRLDATGLCSQKYDDEGWPIAQPVIPPGYDGSQTGTSGLDTDGTGSPAVGEKTHSNDTSYQPNGKSLNGDKVPYVAQNPNPDGSYTYPPGTPVYVMNNDNGMGSPGVLGDNATPDNNATGRVEVSPAMADNIGVAQHDNNGNFLNSTTEANITVYYYPR